MLINYLVKSHQNLKSKYTLICSKFLVLIVFNSLKVEGVRGGVPRGEGEGCGRWEEKGGKRDFQRGRNWEKHCITFYKRNATRRNPYRSGREAGVKGTGGGSFRPPCLQLSPLESRRLSRNHTNTWVIIMSFASKI